ncbi:lytic transglycosylase domain-containing protein [Paenibacillus sp. YYML68]|uniref:lytic transglycosylase domain-containing protein n=1 Tax=Paenibacillus sp. YYML68 TaxID=2909250 RepID=UPI002493BABA|nr:lytic transglycosylase domain-containing protein [Paenibacillus sp. YYML68]
MSFWRKKRVYALLLLTFLLFLFLSSSWMGRLIYPIHYKEVIQQHAVKYKLDPFLIAAIIRVETNYKPDVSSVKGAYGLMQLMPDTSDWIIDKAPFDKSFKQRLDQPVVNIELGAWYLNWMDKQFDGNLYAVIAGYNAGHGKVSRWMSEGEWDGTFQHVDRIPYGETRHYVQRVMYYYDKYEKLYAEEWMDK